MPDNRDHFIFGTSKRVSLRRAAAKIQEHIADADFLVTHSGAHDTEFLDSCGVSIAGKLMFDTQILATALLPDGPPLYSLKRLLEDLEIKFDEKILHNGGNDAVYTMKVFLTLTQHALWRALQFACVKTRSPVVTPEIPSHNSFTGISIPVDWLSQR